MALNRINTAPTRRQLRQFAAIWFPAFWLVVGWLVGRLTGSVVIPLAIWMVVLIVCVVGFLRPDLMRYVFVGWMTAAYPIGWTISHLLLAIVYYGVLTPIGLALRALGRNPLQRKLDPTATTYWQPHRPVKESSRYFRQY